MTCRTHLHFTLLRLSKLQAGLPLEKPAGGRMQGGRMVSRPETYPLPPCPGRSLGNI